MPCPEYSLVHCPVNLPLYNPSPYVHSNVAARLEPLVLLPATLITLILIASHRLYMLSIHNVQPTFIYKNCCLFVPLGSLTVLISKQ